MSTSIIVAVHKFEVEPVDLLWLTVGLKHRLDLPAKVPVQSLESRFVSRFQIHDSFLKLGLCCSMLRLTESRKNENARSRHHEQQIKYAKIEAS